jgi:hypothetical protein
MVPVWFAAAVAIVVVLVVGMTLALLDSSTEVDRLDAQVYPPGAKVALAGGGVLAVSVGRKTMGPGWFAVGRYGYTVSFPDGAAWTSGPDALVIVDQHDLTVRCDSAAHTCEVVSASGQ